MDGLASSQVGDMMKMADTDGDGEISLEEFMGLLRCYRDDPVSRMLTSVCGTQIPAHIFFHFVLVAKKKKRGTFIAQGPCFSF